jgi:hypothetical protein
MVLRSSRTFDGIAVAWLVLMGACACLLAFGVLGVTRGDGPAFQDVRYFQVAAELVLRGLSPYDPVRFAAASRELGLGGDIGVFPYPPHSLLVWLPLAALPFDVGRWAWTAANVAVLAAIALTMARVYLVRAHGDGPQRAHVDAVFVAAVIVGLPSAANLVWTGQTGLFVLGALLLGWKYARERRTVLAAVFLFIASIKPQISILVLLWLLIDGHARAVAAAALLGAVSLALAALAVGPGVLGEWLSSATSYQSNMTRSLPYNANLASALRGWGVPLGEARWVLPGAALVYLALLAAWDRRHALDRNDVLAALLTASLFLIYGRDYDLATLAPLVPALWFHSRHSRSQRAAGLVLLALLCVPQRLVAAVGPEELRYWKIVLLGVLLIWITWALLRAPQSDRDRSATEPSRRHGATA